MNNSYCLKPGFKQVGFKQILNRLNFFMKVTVNKLARARTELLIEVSGPEVDEFERKALKDLSQDLEIQGFRRGRVPEQMAREKLGQEKIRAGAIEEAIKESYARAVLEHEIEPVSPPEIEILSASKPPENSSRQINGGDSKARGLVFKARVQVLPMIELPDYKEIASKIQKKEVEVHEEEIQASLAWLQKTRAKRSQVLRPAQKGDFVEIEFSSPQATREGPQKDAFILGQGRFIPGFEEELEGMEPGQEKEFTLPFPQTHFHQELRGREATFRVKMRQVQKVELPELDDQFAKEIGKFEGLDQLKASIKGGLQHEKERAESHRIRQQILEEICQKIALELPEALIEKEQEKMMQELRQGVEQQFRLPLSEYLKQVKKTEEEVRRSFKEAARQRVKHFLVLRKISEKEGIAAAEEEVMGEVNRLLKSYPDKEKATRDLDLHRLKEYIREVIIQGKTLEKLEGFSRR